MPEEDPDFVSGGYKLYTEVRPSAPQRKDQFELPSKFEAFTCKQDQEGTGLQDLRQDLRDPIQDLQEPSKDPKPVDCSVPMPQGQEAPRDVQASSGLVLTLMVSLTTVPGIGMPCNAACNTVPVCASATERTLVLQKANVLCSARKRDIPACACAVRSTAGSFTKVAILSRQTRGALLSPHLFLFFFGWV